MLRLSSINMEIVMLKKRIRYYNLLEKRFYQKNLKIKIKNQYKILQEIEN